MRNPGLNVRPSNEVRSLAVKTTNAILTGQSLMRQSNTADAVRKLLSGTGDTQ